MAAVVIPSAGARPALWSHDRHAALSPLAPADAQALVEVFSAFADEPSDALCEGAKQCLERLHALHHWVECRCVADGPAPLLFPRRRESGRFELVRQAGSLHEATCALRQTREARSRPDDAAKGPQRESKFFRGFTAFGTTARPSRGRESDGDSREASCHRPKELVLLLRAWREAGLDRVRIEDLAFQHHGDAWLPRAKDVPAHYQQLRDRLAGLEVEPGIMLEDVTAWSPTAIPWVLDRLQRGVHRFNNVRPQGFFLGCVGEVEPRRLVRQSKDKGVQSVDVAQDVVRSGRQTQGPYAAIALLGQGSEGARFEVLRAGVWPVLSKQLLLPVDSDLERATANWLLSLQRWLHEKCGVATVLWKPVEDLGEGSADGAVRPDFVLMLPGGRQIVVETMGDGAPEYLERKQRTHPRMRALPNVVGLFEHWPSREPDRQLGRQIAALATRINANAAASP